MKAYLLVNFSICILYINVIFCMIFYLSFQNDLIQILLGTEIFLPVTYKVVTFILGSQEPCKESPNQSIKNLPKQPGIYILYNTYLAKKAILPSKV